MVCTLLDTWPHAFMVASTPSFPYFCMSSKLFIMVIPPNIRHSAAIAPIRAPLASRCTYMALHNKSRIFLHRNMFGSKPLVRLMTWQLWNPTLIFACHGAACFRSQDKMRLRMGEVPVVSGPGAWANDQDEGSFSAELAPRIRNVRQ